jgi:hypothetical protein
MSSDNSPTHDDLMRSLLEDLALCQGADRPPWRASRGTTVWYINGPEGTGTIAKVYGGKPRRDGEANAAFMAAARTICEAAIRRAVAAEPMVEFLRDEGQARGEEVARLKALTESLAARCAAQSELLSQRAERQGEGRQR